MVKSTAPREEPKNSLRIADNTSPGAAVRKAFRQGRPPKNTGQLHPEVAWAKSASALDHFRALLVAAGLDPLRVRAEIVYVTPGPHIRPHFLAIEKPEKTREQVKEDALKVLHTPGVVVLGMMFVQEDETGGTDGGKGEVIFPHQFTGLSEMGILQLRLACVTEQKLRDIMRKSGS